MKNLILLALLFVTLGAFAQKTVHVNVYSGETIVFSKPAEMVDSIAFGNKALEVEGMTASASSLVGKTYGYFSSSTSPNPSNIVTFIDESTCIMVRNPASSYYGVYSVYSYSITDSKITMNRTSGSSFSTSYDAYINESSIIFTSPDVQFWLNVQK